MSEPATIHYTELAPAKVGESFFDEWNTYLGEIARLLVEGQEGKFALIKSSAIVGIFESESEALREGNERFPGQQYFVHQIREKEPIIRVRGYNLPWTKTSIQLARPA
jgi:hypothetical protein